MHKNWLIGIFVLTIVTSGFAQNPKWTAWETEADTLMSHEEFSKAIARYSKIIKASRLKQKENYRPLYKRAVAYYSSGQWQPAIADMNKFIPEFPQSYQARILRALAYRELNDIDKQLTDVESAIELSGGDPQLLRWRGSLRMEKEEYELAKKDFKQIIQIQDDPEIEMNLALTHYSLQELDSALLAVNKAIELDGTYGAAYFYGGAFALEQEQYEQAVKFLDVALRLDPENLQALFYKGIALVELKREDEGCRCLNKAFYGGVDDAADYLKQSCYEVLK
ncbi:MAG TPA: tetratricopeptide repeat protein [Cyclobacteriaceae bacterium]|nr:tetratricopeptide repeat protein [Cyclobacteriaceae bacterium]